MYENIIYNLKSDYPIAIYPKKVGTYAALTKIGGGYFWDDVLEYRVWLHPEMGAEDIYDGNDYFYSFPTFESALDYKNKNKGTESPLVLILQKEWIDEPEPKIFIHKKGERITEWQVNWLNDSKRQRDSIEQFVAMAIDKGNSEAMFALGSTYDNEYKDYKNAEKCYLMAIDKDHSDAMYNLGWIYDNEYKDYKKAEEYYLMAIDKGHSNAMYNLGCIYHNEYNNYKKAEEYYLIAIDKGHSNAMYNLGCIYHNEYNNYKKTEEYYLMAIDKGHSEAMNELAWIYFCLSMSKNKALEISEKAFELAPNIYSACTFACILIWNDEVEKSKNIADFFLSIEQSYQDFYQDIFNYFILLLAKKQYFILKEIFEENKFDSKEKFKDIYSVLLCLINKKELIDNEIIRKVHLTSERYN